MTNEQIDKLKSIDIPWGEIGYITYKRTYSRRIKDDKVNSQTEEYIDTVLRIVKACQKQLKINFTPDEEFRLSEILMTMKGTVAGRFLWQLGTKTVDNLGLPSLQNCAVTVVNEPIRPFTWAMELLMLGCGVGYNIQKEYVYQIPTLRKEKITIERFDDKSADYIVPDTREGWVKLLGKVLKAHFYTGKGFTYSCQLIRSEGEPIKSFGGTASGPQILSDGMDKINNILNGRSGKKLRPIDCLDVMNLIASIVVAGNVRRSAQIAIGDWDDIEFLKAKRWDLGSVPNWRSNSNNSIVPPTNFDDLPLEFWQTYEQGEPYGIINLELSRKCGRINEFQYPDPNVVCYNPCVSGDTEILTDFGYARIDSLIDRSVNVWNGFEFSEVSPKITGYNQPMVKVTLSSGQTLKCTTYHNFVLSNGDRVKAKDLKIGEKLLKTKFPTIDVGNALSNAYAIGFYAGDGTTNKNDIWLYHTKFMCQQRLMENGVKFGFEQENRKLGHTNEYYSKTFVPINYNLSSKLNWLSGLIDSDGTLLKDGQIQVTSVDNLFLCEIQKMLTTIGCSSKVSLERIAGSKNIKGTDYDCKSTYRLLLSAMQVKQLFMMGMRCERIDLSVVNPNRDATRFITITNIETIENEDVVYCFDEPLRHLGCFEGIVTGQCAEQSLENYETCCLADIFLPNIKTKDELFEVATYLYRINKHSLALHCSIPETEEIVHKNMRMGIGITGFLQASDEQKSWLNDCYVYLRQFDVEYSKINNWPTSIKLTTIKPSGSVSLLPGVTPGAHPSPAGPYYIRRIRMSSSSELVNVCKKNGYFVENVRGFDGKPDPTTVVVEFPCKVPEGTPVGDELGAINHLEIVKWLQTNWSDNSVSCTIYYKKEELDDIKQWLKQNFNENVKTVSFLLYYGHGFDQAPYETITKERYLELIKNVHPITSISVNEDDFELQDCDNGSCPIK